MVQLDSSKHVQDVVPCQKISNNLIPMELKLSIINTGEVILFPNIDGGNSSSIILHKYSAFHPPNLIPFANTPFVLIAYIKLMFFPLFADICLLAEEFLVNIHICYLYVSLWLFHPSKLIRYREFHLYLL
ncbi:hypothetical protein H311_00055 [Anncaliia algerae PRA109]|nr:hypothetical protein H311_00055 [Anncaliia algerae PRA109]